MDELKLNKWKENFEQEAKSIQTAYNSFFLTKKLEELYTIRLDKSGEWELQLNEQLPKEIRDRLTQIFLSAKPEDSI